MDSDLKDRTVNTKERRADAPSLAAQLMGMPGAVPDGEAAKRIHRRREIRPVSRVYSRFVTGMKFALPALALAVMALIAVWPSLTELPTLRI